MTPNIPTIAQAQPDIISPAEAKFWQEWADKAPALVRQDTEQIFGKLNAQFAPYKIGGIALGAVFGGLSLTKYIPGKWKIASVSASIASIGIGLMMGGVKNSSDKARAMFELYTDALEKDPMLQKRLADYLSATVTADLIKEMGVEKAVSAKAIDFGMHTPYLQSMGQGRSH